MRKQNIRCGENSTCISEHVVIEFGRNIWCAEITTISVKRGRW